jgi:putative hemolysin
VLLLFSFYFSGSETAIFSLNRLERNSLRETKSKKKKRILGILLDNQDQLLITILTGNMIVNIFASSLGGEIGAYLFAGQSEFLSIIAMTVLLLLVGELTPKRIAVNHSKEFSRLTAIPLYGLHRFFSPVRFILNHISVWVLNIFHSNLGAMVEDKHALVLSTAELGYNQDILVHSEYSMFKSYLAFKDKSAGGVMTPRILLKTLSYDLTIAEVLDLISSSPEYVINSSLILHKEDSDHLFGWVPVVNVLKCKFEQKMLSERVSRLSEKFHTVPQSKELPTLIIEMREADTDIALLVDEYGGTAGIVWFRDIIQDVLRVFNSPHKGKLEKDQPASSEITGSMTMEEFQDFLGIDIDVDSETVAGFFLESFGSIPVPGDEVLFREIRLKVIEMDGNKITRLELEIRPEL